MKGKDENEENVQTADASGENQRGKD